MNPTAASFAGTYELKHALRGLRLQLIPFAGLSAAFLAVAVAVARIHTATSTLLVVCAAVVAVFMITSYLRERERSRLRPPHGDVSGEVSPDGLIMRSGGREEPRAWDGFVRAQLLPSMILLHNPDGSAVILPVEFFDRAGWRAARRIVRQTRAAKEHAVPLSLKLGFLALCAALVAFYTLYLLSRAAAP